MNHAKLVVAAALLLAAGPSLAHETKGPNGGRVVDAGSYHVELVVSGAQVDVFVSDGSDKALTAAGFKAVAILNAGGKAQRVALESAGSKLSGKAGSDLPANVKGVVQLTAPDGKVAQGQFK